MATFDQLSDEQRAIVELVLQQGKSYDELSGMLGLPERRVRELARDALVDLAPLSARGVEEDWRGQLADYVLGQQAGPEVTATRGHLRRSEAARIWASSLLDSLEQLYPNGDMPAIPVGERAARRTGAPRSGDTATAVAGDPVKRRRILAGAGVVTLMLIGLLVWPLGLLTSADDDEGQASSESASGSQPDGQNETIPTATQGQVSIIKQGKRLAVVAQATGLEPGTGNEGYQVWLYNSTNDRRALQAGAPDQQGNLAIPAVLPADYRKYGFVDVTSVIVQGQQLKPGASVLRGEVQLLDKPVTAGKGKNRGTLLARFRLVPLPGSGG